MTIQSINQVMKNMGCIVMGVYLNPGNELEYINLPREKYDGQLQAVIDDEWDDVISVVKRTFGFGYSREKIAALLKDAVGGGLSRESLYIFQERVLLAELKTSDVKSMAIEEAEKLIKEQKKKLKGLKKYGNQRYSLEEEVNNLCGMILMTAIELAEPASGVEYYFRNCKETDKEITLYCALDIVDWEEDHELWIQVYEYGVGKKIKPGDALVKNIMSLRESAGHIPQRRDIWGGKGPERKGFGLSGTKALIKEKISVLLKLRISAEERS